MSNISIEDVEKIYRKRFKDTGLEKRNRVWKALCRHYFNAMIGDSKDVLDLACGYGEFINNISARTRYAIDLNPDAPRHLREDVKFHKTPSTDLSAIDDGSIDIVFTSNFLEHLPNHASCDQTFDEVRRVLRKDGRFIIMGPNIKYAYKEYWDFYDHHLALSHLSLEEALEQKSFRVTENIARFLPFTMKGKAPSGDALIKVYLNLPILWTLFGKQFLITATPLIS